MTHTTTDAAEARALTVIQADRDAAAGWIGCSPYDVVKAEAEMIRIGQLDGHRLTQAFARHRLATAEAASGAGEREGGADAPSRIWLCGYDTDHGDISWSSEPNPTGDPEVDGRQVAYVRASLPPATDPAMVTVPREDWDTAYRAFVGAFDTPLARRRHDDEYAADARRRLRDLDEALAAAPTIPATQSDGWTDAGRAWLAAGAPTIPATGEAAKDGSAMELHPNTAKLVDDFAVALSEKLARAEQKYGYADNWRTDDWEADCQAELARHVKKGDPLDVAAYAAFCWSRGYRTAPPQMAVLRSVPDIVFTPEQRAFLDKTRQGGRISPTVVVFTRDLIDVERAVAAVLVDEPLGRLRSRTEAAHDLLNRMIPAPTIPATGEAEAPSMKQWNGGDQEPDDWDEKADVLLSTGFQTKLKRGLLGYWAPDNGDILARVRLYTPKATIPATGHAATEGEG